MVSSRCQGIKRPGSRPFKGRWEAKSEILGGLAVRGALVAHPPLEIPGNGTFAIYIQGDVDHGLWQL